MKSYLTVEELSKFVGEAWDPEWDAVSEEWLIPYGEAGLRRIFKNYGLNLDESLENGDIEIIVLKSVLAEMIYSSLSARSKDSGFGDASQFSQSAGGYSISVSGLSGVNLYLKKAQARILGLPSVVVSGLKII